MLAFMSTQMQQFTSTELANKTGDVLAAAAQAPVKIARHNKARYVMLTVESYEQLVQSQDTRRAVHVSELSDTEAEAMVAALQASIDND